MHIVNTLWKKTKQGGYYLCRVFYSSGRSFSEVTEQVAKKFSFELDKNNLIKIYFGSGTGYMRISEALQGNDASVEVSNVSI